MFSVFAAFVLAFSVLFARGCYLILAHPLAPYPGPLLAKYTYLCRFFGYARGRQHLADLELHLTYGPVVRDGPESVLVADIDAYKAIYSSCVPNGNVTFQNVIHLATQPSKDLEPLISKSIGEWLDRLRKDIQLQKGKLDIVTNAKLFAFDIVLQTTLGDSLDLLKPDVNAQDELAALENMISRTVPDSRMSILSSVLKLSSVLRPKLRPEHVLKNLIRVSVQDPASMSENEIDERAHVLLLSSLAIAAALTAIFYELGCHPEIQDALHDSLLCTDSQLALDFLRHIILEALRLHPPLPAPVERIVTPGAEKAVFGHRRNPLPAGTRVWSNPYVINRTRAVFGEDADDFCPERWDRRDPGLDPEILREMEDVVFIFGRGVRESLVERALAWAVLERVVAKTIRGWKLSCAPGSLRGRSFQFWMYDALPMAFERR